MLTTKLLPSKKTTTTPVLGLVGFAAGNYAQLALVQLPDSYHGGMRVIAQQDS